MIHLSILLLVKLLDPVPIIICGIGGTYCRQWWQLIALASVSAVISETFLARTIDLYKFDPLAFAVAVIAAGMWGLVGLLIGRGIRRRRAKRIRSLPNPTEP
jgi:hypothetical protein